MQNSKGGLKIVLARDIGGCTELIEWIRQADTVWIVRDGQERTIAPEAWRPSGVRTPDDPSSTARLLDSRHRVMSF